MHRARIDDHDPPALMPTEHEAITRTAVLDQLDRLAVELVGATNAAISEVGAGDLSFPQWRLLMVLGGSEGPLRLRDIAGRVSASMPSASRLVERMHRRGFVSSERDPKDGRGRLVSLTVRGEEVRTLVIARRRSMIEEGLRGPAIPPGLIEGLDRIVQGMITRGGSGSPGRRVR